MPGVWRTPHRLRKDTRIVKDRLHSRHVLTNMHVVYADDIVFNPSAGKAVKFAVGQTEGDGTRGALQGLRFLLSGAVVAYGDTMILDHLVHVLSTETSADRSTS